MRPIHFKILQRVLECSTYNIVNPILLLGHQILEQSESLPDLFDSCHANQKKIKNAQLFDQVGFISQKGFVNEFNLNDTEVEF